MKLSSEMKHISARLSSDTLQSHCKSGATESEQVTQQHCMGHGVQSKFSVGIHRLKFSVCDAICTCDSEAQSRRHL